MTVTVELVGTPAGIARTVALVTALGSVTDVIVAGSDDHCPEPELRLLTDIPGTPAVTPAGDDPVDDTTATVVWVRDAATAEDLVGRQRTIAVTADHELAARTAIPLASASAVEVDRWPVLFPLVRRRWRERFGLPEPFVVEVDGDITDPATTTALALCSAAVVVGPAVPVALALGTPTVTSPEDAAPLGAARDRGALSVVERSTDRLDAARRIAEDTDELARRCLSAHTFARDNLDLGPALHAVIDLIGLSPDTAEEDLAPLLADRLVELGTPPGNRIALRAGEATFRPIEAIGDDDMAHPAIDPRVASALGHPDGEPGSASAPGGAVSSKLRSVARRVGAPVLVRARRALEDASHDEVEALRREVQDLRAELGRTRAHHAADMAVLRAKVDANAGDGPTVHSS